MCWLTVGLLLGEPGHKLVHVLILLLSNQVENKSGVSGGWANRVNIFLVFPCWGISLSKKYTCILLHNRRNFSLVVCCRTGCVLCIGQG